MEFSQLVLYSRYLITYEWISSKAEKGIFTRYLFKMALCTMLSWGLLYHLWNTKLLNECYRQLKQLLLKQTQTYKKTELGLPSINACTVLSTQLSKCCKTRMISLLLLLGTIARTAFIWKRWQHHLIFNISGSVGN